MRTSGRPRPNVGLGYFDIAIAKASATKIARGWQAVTGYGKRALIGQRLRSRSFPAQQTEVATGCIVLNRMTACGRPESIRRQVSQA
jgi:hypothetical protein